MNHRAPTLVVIAGLDPAIHSVDSQSYLERYGMDARVKPGQDDRGFDICFGFRVILL